MDVRFEGVSFNVKHVAAMKVNDFIRLYKDHFFQQVDAVTRKELLSKAHALCVSQIKTGDNSNGYNSEAGGD